jgi:WD40 repeat protein
MVIYSPHNQYLAMEGEHDIWVQEVAGGREVAHWQDVEGVQGLAFSSDGQYLAIASRDRTAKVRELRPNREMKQFPHDTEVAAVAFGPDDQHLVTASGNTARVWDLGSGKEILRVTHEGGGKGSHLTPGIKVLPDDVTAVALSPDGKYLATGSSDQTVRVWAVNSGQEVLRMVHEKAVTAVAYSQDGKRLATTDAAGAVWLWEVTRGVGEVARGDEVARFTHDYAVLKVALSLDGRYLVAATSGDTLAHVWDVRDNTKLSSVDHGGNIKAMAFSPDSQYLATASDGTTARVWEIRSGTEVPAVEHQDVVTALTRPQDQRYRTVVEGEVVQVRDGKSNEELGVLVHEGGVNDTAFSSDGRYLATVGNDGTARVWLWQAEDLITAACAHLIYNLTPTGWTQYLGEEAYRKTCPNLPVHPSYLEEGRILAWKGEREQAKQIFATLKELDNRPELDPEAEVRRYAALGLVEQAKTLARKGEVNTALANFEEARTLDKSLEIPYTVWHTLCRFGSIWGEAARVKEACERAVESAPQEHKVAYRDSRGIDRALTGDTAGAIEDFTAVVRWARENGQDEEYRKVREEWIAKLEKKENPFTEETLKELLRNE